jgi:hypothetical protein
VSNVDGYQYFAVDFQDISALTNAVNEGVPLPSSDILAIYERGKNFRTPAGELRSLRAFARADARAREFPEAAAFYGSGTFLDAPVVQAIAGVGSASGYSPAQRRQVIQKGIQRILYYHVLQELSAALPKIEAIALRYGAQPRDELQSRRSYRSTPARGSQSGATRRGGWRRERIRGGAARRREPAGRDLLPWGGALLE